MCPTENTYTKKKKKSLEAKEKKASLIPAASPHHADGVDINLHHNGSSFIYNLITNSSFNSEAAIVVNHTLNQLFFNFSQIYFQQIKGKNLKKWKDTESLLYSVFKVHVLLLPQLYSEI